MSPSGVPCHPRAANRPMAREKSAPLMIGAMRKLTLPIPLKTSQRGAWASCHSLPTTTTPSSHPKKNVPITRTQYDRMIG